MPNRLHRYYGAGYSHFITTSCWDKKRGEKLRYMHRNPVKGELVLSRSNGGGAANGTTLVMNLGRYW